MVRHQTCLFGSEPALRPQPLTKEVQRVNTRTAPDRKTRQQRDTLINAQIMKHRVAEMNTPRRKRTPRKIIPGKQTRSILRVTKRQVQEDTLNDEENTNRGDHNTDTRHNPVHVLAARPSKDEKPGRHKERHE